jgi:hypothetical protein
MGPITPPAACLDGNIHAGRSPLRRLTRFEYNNTVRDIFADATNPATLLPAEELGNGFGNDADHLSVPSLLAEQYGTVAEGIANRATATPAAMAKFHPCASNVAAGMEDACTTNIANFLLPRIYRRPAEGAEIADLVAVAKAMRAAPPSGSTPAATFALGVSGMIQTMLQAPDFLYRIEWGVADAAKPTIKRPTGDEMATRLSYLFWGTTPDDTLRTAAKSGELITTAGVLSQATRLLNDAKSHAVVRYFFDSLLPINGLTDLERDATLFPAWTATIGSYMREETQKLLEFEIYDPAGSGTWPGALTAPYTFLNGPLAAYYGVGGVTGTAYQKVDLDTTKRLGFLMHGSMMAGTTQSNHTNPVARGSFVMQKMLCNTIALPTGDILAMVKPPDPYSAPTARERYTLHKTQAVCAACHTQMDPIGFTFENFDPVGIYRTTENNVNIDVTGSLPTTREVVTGPTDLVRKLAATNDVETCFASDWLDYGYGRTTGVADECAQASVNVAFQKSGWRIKDLLIALTQTDEFLYFPGSP